MARMMLIAHNLVRAMTRRAAIGRGCEHRAISFKGCLDLLLAWKSRHRGRNHHVRRVVELDAELLEIIATKKNNGRPFRSEPRAVKQRPKSYPYLTKPRHE